MAERKRRKASIKAEARVLAASRDDLEEWEKSASESDSEKTELSHRLPDIIPIHQPDSSDDDEMEQTCSMCDGTGRCIKCQVCRSPYHLTCASLQSSRAHFICRPCESSCCVCEKQNSSAGDYLISCRYCRTQYHLECVDVPVIYTTKGRWACPICELLPLPCKVEKILDWRPQPLTHLDARQINTNVKREFFVKWLGHSYIHCRWIKEGQLARDHPMLLRNFLKRWGLSLNANSFDHDELENDEPGWTNGVKDDWMEVERVILVRLNEGMPEYLIKWKELGYECCTWENQSVVTPELLHAYEIRERGIIAPVSMYGPPPRAMASMKYDTQPRFLHGTPLNLHPYQLEGLNWLRYSWAHGTPTILADEMGLGKTIQTISFLASLYQDGHSAGPFLICVPLSTLANWQRELALWAPFFNVVSYTGSAAARQVIRDYELVPNQPGMYCPNNVTTIPRSMHRIPPVNVKFNVLLTSYEMVVSDAACLGSVDWEVLVVDEAHRLKNSQSKFAKVLNDFSTAYRFLLTGTPLQNNLEELYHLLSFLKPRDFRSLYQFQNEFADVSKEAQIAKLHELLAPHLLRRLKADVLKDMPTKSEFIVCVDLAPLQKKYYKYILTKNFEELNKTKGKSVSLLNIMAELKKCCNHPFLFPAAHDEADAVSRRSVSRNDQNNPEVPNSLVWQLIHGSGKLHLLDKMLTRLRDRGHRVLIFSQMTKLLDLLEDYLRARRMEFERIDGSVMGSARQERIDRFNAPGSSRFCFLLSTRAGGLGINLATADTVIIYDSDWNPHNDIQAFSRAHRIGQANKVMIYRFVTRGTVEERIVELAKRKMMLTHLIVRGGMGGGKQKLAKEDLDDILRFGTAELFAHEDEEEEEAMANGYSMPAAHKEGGIVYDNDAIENLLDRSQEGLEQKEHVANEYLSSFKVAQFNTKIQDEDEEDETEEGTKKRKKRKGRNTKDKDGDDDDDDAKFWEKMLRDRHDHMTAKEIRGKGKRNRKPVNYLSQGIDMMYADFSSESEHSADEEEEDDADSYDAASSPAAVEESRKRGRSRKPYVRAPLMEQTDASLLVMGFTSRQRGAFSKSLKRVGLVPYWEQHLQQSHHLRRKRWEEIRDYGELFIEHLCEDMADPGSADSAKHKDGVPRELSRSKERDLLTRIGCIHLICRKVDQYLPHSALRPGQISANISTRDVQLAREKIWALGEDQGHDFHIADGGLTPLHDEWKAAAKEQNPNRWNRRQDLLLLMGHLKHGMANWSAIVADEALGLQKFVRAVMAAEPLDSDGNAFGGGIGMATAFTNDDDGEDDDTAKKDGKDETKRAKTTTDGNDGTATHDQAAGEPKDGTTNKEKQTGANAEAPTTDSMDVDAAVTTDTVKSSMKTPSADIPASQTTETTADITSVATGDASVENMKASDAVSEAADDRNPGNSDEASRKSMKDEADILDETMSDAAAESRNEVKDDADADTKESTTVTKPPVADTTSTGDSKPAAVPTTGDGLAADAKPAGDGGPIASVAGDVEEPKISEEQKMSVMAAKFLGQRTKVLETALLIEDQLLRGVDAGLEIDQSANAIGLLSVVEEVSLRLDLLHEAAVKAYGGDRDAGLFLRKGLRQVDLLIGNAKVHLMKLPQHLSELPGAAETLNLSAARMFARIQRTRQKGSPIAPHKSAPQPTTGDLAGDKHDVHKKALDTVMTTDDATAKTTEANVDVDVAKVVDPITAAVAVDESTVVVSSAMEVDDATPANAGPGSLEIPPATLPTA